MTEYKNMKDRLMENLKTRNSQSDPSMRSEEMPGGRKPGTVYIDCSFTIYSGLNTGIQRVVRNIICRSNSLSSTFNVPCIPVVFAFGRTWAIGNLSAASKLFNIKKRFDRFARLLLHFFISILAPIKSIIPEGKLRSGLKKTYSRLYGLANSMWRWAQVVSSVLYETPRPISVSRGDLLLAADAFWTHNVIDAMEDLSRRGVCIVPIIYDLIPITHPEYVDENNARAFTAVVDRFLSISDGVIGISKSVRSDVMD